MKISDIEVSKLHEYFTYDPESGLFTWKMRDGVSPQWIGKHAFKRAFTTITPSGYYLCSIGSVRILAHRAAWAMQHGEWPIDCIDHINCDKLDNRISNLREATKSTNGMNRGRQSNNSSGHKGIHFDESRGKWIVQLSINGKRVVMKRFTELNDALIAHKEALEIYHGEFSRC